MLGDIYNLHTTKLAKVRLRVPKMGPFKKTWMKTTKIDRFDPVGWIFIDSPNV